MSLPSIAARPLCVLSQPPPPTVHATSPTFDTCAPPTRPDSSSHCRGRGRSSTRTQTSLVVKRAISRLRRSRSRDSKQAEGIIRPATTGLAAAIDRPSRLTCPALGWPRLDCVASERPPAGHKSSAQLGRKGLDGVREPPHMGAQFACWRLRVRQLLSCSHCWQTGPHIVRRCTPTDSCRLASRPLGDRSSLGVWERTASEAKCVHQNAVNRILAPSATQRHAIPQRLVDGQVPSRGTATANCGRAS